MVAEVRVLFATQDTALNVVNAAVALQAIELKPIDIYEARLRNIGLFKSRVYGAFDIAEFAFPAPFSETKGYVAKFCLADEDDCKLLNDALNNYHGTTPLPNEKLRLLEKKAKSMNYDVELLKPAQMYAHMRLACGDDGTVDAFLGYKFEPTRESIAKLMGAYPGVIKITKPKFDICSVSLDPKPQPGVEVVKDRAEAAKKDRRGETPSIDDMKFFHNLLGIYDKKKDTFMTVLDKDLYGVFASSKSVLPCVKEMTYVSTLAKNGRTFEFKTDDEVLNDIMNSSFNDLAKGLFD